MATKFTGNVEWYTPALYIEKAREVMGGIDLDPATCAEAQKTVKATRCYMKNDDGLEQPWSGRVFMNPPFKMPEVQRFISKLCKHVEAGDVPRAILLTNNNTDTGWWHQAAKLADAFCFTHGRIRFYKAAMMSSTSTALAPSVMTRK